MIPNPPISVTDEELIRLLREDVPYFDLTGSVLGIGDEWGEIRFSLRHDTVVCGTEEAARLLELCGATITLIVRSGETLSAGSDILIATGRVSGLHLAWKVALNLLEYLSGIASKTRAMVDAARKTNEAIQIATTRKVFPGTKSLAVKAVLAGGGILHRLGLSETILIFAQHRAIMGGWPACLSRMAALRQQNPEKKIIVEVEHYDEAIAVVKAGVDVLQIDKMPIALLQETVAAVRSLDATVSIGAAGGVTLDNIEAYAATGIDLIVTSAPYAAQPADILTRIVPKHTPS